MKRQILLVVAITLGLSCGAAAEDKQLGVTLDVSYLTKWLSKGAQAYGDKGAIFETADIDLYDTGFGVKVTHRNATSSGYVDKERFDYRPYYKGQLFQGEPHATNYNISAGYEHYPGLARNKANTTWEWIFAFSWPELLPQGIVPRYIAHYEYPAGSGYTHSDITGWVHRFGLGYDVSVPELPSRFVNLSWEIAYTDGLGGSRVAHDWSYTTFGAATKLEVTESLSFVPGIYYQLSMEDTVNDQNELYGILSMKYKF